MGSIIKRKDSRFWWIQYYKAGKRFSESTKTEKYEEADVLLKIREGELALGKPPTRSFDQIKFFELCDDFLADYRIKGNKSLAKAIRSVRYLKAYFGDIPHPQVDTSFIRKYIESRDKALMSDGSINRELAALKRIFNVGLESTPPKVALCPYIPFKKELNTRHFFFTHGQFLQLVVVLPQYLRPVVRLLYETGMRKSEVLNLEWDRVEPVEGVIDLTEKDTKNQRPRKIFLSPEMKAEIQKLWINRESTFVFTRDGDRIKDFRFAWDRACEKIGLPGRWVHDLRRCGLRNLRRAGVTEEVSMRISGHKTRSVFLRYNVTDEDDLRDAVVKRNRYLATVEEKLGDHYKTDTVQPVLQNPSENGGIVSA